MDKRQITKLWKKVESLGVIYEVKNGKVIERKLGDDDGDKVSKEIWQDKALDNGCWRFCVFYAGKLLERYTDFIGLEKDGKLIQGSFKGGFYLGGYTPYGGKNSEFYISKEYAEKALEAIRNIDYKKLLIDAINDIKKYAQNCLSLEDVCYFEDKTDDMLEFVNKIHQIKKSGE